MRDVIMDKKKLDFWKKFSIVIFLYLFLLANLWFVPEWDLIGKISWTFFLLMMLHYTYATLDLVTRIELWLEANRRHVMKKIEKFLQFLWNFFFNVIETDGEMF